VYKDIDFGVPGEKAYGSMLMSLSADAAVTGAIEARLGGPTGQLLATLDIKNTGNVSSWPAVFIDHYATIGTRGIAGTHDVYLCFAKDATLDMDFFIFSEYYKNPQPFNIRSDGYADDAVPLPTPIAGAKYYFGDKEPNRYDWLKNAHFAMFVHLGAYSEQAGHSKGTVQNPKGTLNSSEAEWIMRRSSPIFSRSEYMEMVAANFSPHNWNAADIVKLAQSAGQTYIIITTRHHEGFSLWDTNIRWNRDYKLPTFSKNPHYYYPSDDPRSSPRAFNLALNLSSPFDRDIIRELSDACKATYGTEKEVFFGTYITIQDWYDPSQALIESSSNTSLSDTPSAAYKRMDFLARLKGSVRELLEDYDSRALWFDGSGGAVSSWYSDGYGIELYEFARTIKPKVLVNRRYHRGGSAAGTNPPRGLNHPWAQIDFHTPEKSKGPIDPRLQDFEACMTIGDKWGYRADDMAESKNKSVKELVEWLVDCTAKGGNLLLNIGPKGDGSVPSIQRQRLEGIGKWMDTHGKSIYNTRKSPLELHDPTGANYISGSYATVNHELGEIYVHLVNHSDSSIHLPLINKQIIGAHELVNNKPLVFSETAKNVCVDLGNIQRNDINTVIVIKYAPDGTPLAVVPASSSAQATSIAERSDK
jgi:alpha-L-fucosidase